MKAVIQLPFVALFATLFVASNALATPRDTISQENALQQFGKFYVEKVIFETPPPTFLESVGRVDKPRAVWKALLAEEPRLNAWNASILADKGITPTDDNPMFDRAEVYVDCRKEFIWGLERVEGYCYFKATHFYGWYADLDLKVIVEGYIANIGEFDWVD